MYGNGRTRARVSMPADAEAKAALMRATWGNKPQPAKDDPAESYQKQVAHVANMPAYKDRAEYIDRVEKQFGPATAQKLWTDVNLLLAARMGERRERYREKA